MDAPAPVSYAPNSEEVSLANHGRPGTRVRHRRIGFSQFQHCGHDAPWLRAAGVYQSCLDARRAPSAMACNFAQAIFGSTVGLVRAKVPKPQSVLAITFSLPTTLA